MGGGGREGGGGGGGGGGGDIPRILLILDTCIYAQTRIIISIIIWHKVTEIHCQVKSLSFNNICQVYYLNTSSISSNGTQFISGPSTAININRDNIILVSDNRLLITLS